jgi:hypothetical protein
MRICTLVAAIVAMSGVTSQYAEAKAAMTLVYDGNDFESYYADPPAWIYLPNGFWHSKSAHWLYKNHRYVFIDIKVN